MLTIALETPLYPTENEAVIRTALLTLFPKAVLTTADGMIRGTTSDATAFKELLRTQHIRDAAHVVLRKRQRGDTVVFRLNKQVAAVGKVNFSADSSKEAPLGDIVVTLRADSEDVLTRFIDDIAPADALFDHVRETAGQRVPSQKPSKFKKAEANVFLKKYDREGTPDEDL